MCSSRRKIGRRHVTTLIKRMGVEALYRRPARPSPKPGHKVYPYLLARYSDHATEPGLGDGNHLHPDGAWLRVPGRCARLISRRGKLLRQSGPPHCTVSYGSMNFCFLHGMRCADGPRCQAARNSWKFQSVDDVPVDCSTRARTIPPGGGAASQSTLLQEQPRPMGPARPH